MVRSFVAAVVVVLMASSVADARGGSITLSDASVSPSRGISTTSTGRVVIDNAGAADRLVSASCSCASQVELHRMWMDGQIMRMRKIEGGMAVPAHGKLVLGNSDQHLMLIGVKPLLKLGAKVTLKLHFQHAGTMSVEAPVQEVAPMPMKVRH
jgi:hypothetical protein